MNSIFWKNKEIVSLVETVKESKLWIIRNSKHNSWKQLDSKLKKSAGSSYKKFNALLTKFAKVDENDSWKHYNLMMTHFPHYAKLNQVNSQSQSPRSFGGSQEQQFEFFTSGLNEKKETLDVIPETDQEDDADSVIMPLQQNYWNDVIFKWQNDPDQIFIAELFKNMQGLNEEMKSLFKIKVQSLMHNLKYNCRSMNYPE